MMTLEQHKLRVGEDMYPGTNRWCGHCSCGWSSVWNDHGAYRRVLPTQEEVELLWAEHLIEAGEAERGHEWLGVERRADRVSQLKNDLDRALHHHLVSAPGAESFTALRTAYAATRRDLTGRDCPENCGGFEAYGSGGGVKCTDCAWWFCY
jgi:hypothetical protein